MPRFLCLFASANFGYGFRINTGMDERFAPADPIPQLRDDNEGCHLLMDEADCTSSKDTREAFLNSPCRWCCGEPCVPGGNKCEPVQWLQGEPTHNGHGKTGLGENTCPEAPEVVTRESLTPCPCTIWQHCGRIDLLPKGLPHGVACVAEPHAIVTLGHQVQCVPDRAGGLNYNCPAILSHMCNPDKDCFEEDLGTCANFDCGNGEYTPKASPPQFCAMPECTHAECCDPLGWWFDMTVLHTMPTPSPETITCPQMESRITEATMERLIAYTDVCGFNAGDVDYSSSTRSTSSTSAQLVLTEPGQAKLASETCQNQRCLTCGHDNVAEEARHVANACKDPVLHAQLAPSGIFGTASALDAVWRAARDTADRPPDLCGVGTEERLMMPKPTMPPSISWSPESMTGHGEGEELVGISGGMPAVTPCPFESEVVGAPSPCAMQTCPDGRCCPRSIIHTRLGSYSKEYTVAFGNDGEERSIPCDIGPYQHGTVEVECTWQGWVISSQRCSRWGLR